MVQARMLTSSPHLGLGGWAKPGSWAASYPAHSINPTETVEQRPEPKSLVRMLVRPQPSNPVILNGVIETHATQCVPLCQPFQRKQEGVSMTPAYTASAGH